MGTELLGVPQNLSFNGKGNLSFLCLDLNASVRLHKI
jgi:hypothetical protein